LNKKNVLKNLSKYILKTKNSKNIIIIVKKMVKERFKYPTTENSNTEKEIISQLKQLRHSIEQLEKKVDHITQRLDQHISFIDRTYEGLKNPIDAARKWLGR